MKTIKLPNTIRMKDQTEILAGSTLHFVRHSEMPTVGIFSFANREFKLRYRSVIKNPSVKSLHKWSDNGVCKSVLGAQVEPDGYGPDGEPSWLLAMGMI